MKYKFLSVAVCAISSVQAAASLAQTTPPVGVATGQVFYFTADATRGAGLDLAMDPGAVGNYLLSGGQTLSLPASPSLEGREGQPSVTVGRGAGAVASAEITGSGSVIELIGSNTGATVAIGRLGSNGELKVSNGALLKLLDEQNEQLQSSASVQLGAQGGNGTFVVDGASVEIESSADAFIFVGANALDFPPPSGSGTVHIVNGSSVVLRDLDTGLPKKEFATAGIIIGQEDGGNGTVTIDGSNVLLDGVRADATIQVAREEGTSGAFNVLGGSTVTLQANSGGSESGSGRFGFISVGTRNGSSGQFLIDEGSVVSLTGPNAFIAVGRQEGSFGNFIVQGGGRLVYDGPNGGAQIGQADPGASNGGVGLLTVAGVDSLFSINGPVDIGQQSGAGSSTGIVTVTDGGVLAASAVNVHEGGTLKGASGTIVGDVNLLGGLIAPGTSIGDLIIEGDLLATIGMISIELGGTGMGKFDRLFVTGDLFATSPLTIEVSLIDDFIPQNGDVFDFLSVAGNTGFGGSSLFNVIGTKLFDFDVNQTSGGFSLTARAVDIPPSAIPLPFAGLMLGSAVICLGGMSRRRSGSLRP